MARPSDSGAADASGPLGALPTVCLILYLLVVEAYYVVLAGSSSSPLDELLAILLIQLFLCLVHHRMRILAGFGQSYSRLLMQ